MHIRIQILLLCVGAPLVSWAADLTGIQPDSEGETVYIANLGATDLPQTLVLRVDSAPTVTLPAQIEFRCTFISPAEYDDVALAIEIERADGPVLYRGRLTTDVPPGEKVVVLRWPVPADLADGKYDVRVTAERPNGTHVASTRLRLRKFSHASVSASVAHASAAVSALDDHVSSLGEETFSQAALHQLAIAHEAIRNAEDAQREANWPRAYDGASEALDAAMDVRAGLTFAALIPERLAESPAVTPVEIVIQNASIVSSSAPVFLYGVRLSLSEAKHISEIGRFGMNAVVLEISPADVLLGPDTVIDLDRELSPILDECARLGIVVTIQLQPQKMAGWALDQWPEMARSQFAPFYYDVTHPRALDVLGKFYGTIGAYADQEPRIFAVSVADAPRFRIGDEPMRRGFAVHLHDYYESSVSLNLAWQTRLPSIDDIAIRWDWEKVPYQAHLQTYHRNQVTGFFSWIVNAMGNNSRNVPLTFTAPGSTFAIGSAKDGIDLDLLNRTFAASSCESAVNGPSSGYGLSFPDAEMQVCLARSLNPGKPVFDLGARVGAASGGLDEGDRYANRELTRLWQSAMAGVDLNAAPFESLFDARGGQISPHDTRELAGYISGGETLNRLAAIVQRFQDQDAPAAILWSESSRIFDNGTHYLPSLRRAYEGAACFGLPLRFISEHQMAAGELGTVTILILPEVSALEDDAFVALDRFVANGGRLVSTGSSIPYTAFGSSRPLRLQASPLTKLVRGAENADNYLRAMDAAFDASDLEEIPRAVDDRGYPILGVVSRYIEDKDGRYLYIANLNSEVRSVHLPVGRLEGRDLIAGRTVQFPLVLEPLDPMLIALTPQVSDEEVALPVEPTPGDQTSALIEPVGIDKSPTPARKAPRPGMRAGRRIR